MHLSFPYLKILDVYRFLGVWWCFGCFWLGFALGEFVSWAWKAVGKKHWSCWPNCLRDLAIWSKVSEIHWKMYCRRTKKIDFRVSCYFYFVICLFVQTLSHADDFEIVSPMDSLLIYLDVSSHWQLESWYWVLVLPSMLWLTPQPCGPVWSIFSGRKL